MSEDGRSSGEVHGVLRVVVDLNRLRQSLRVAAVALTRHVAALGAGRKEADTNGSELLKEGPLISSHCTHHNCTDFLSSSETVSPVVVFVHQVVASAKSHQPGVVGRRRDGD